MKHWIHLQQSLVISALLSTGIIFLPAGTAAQSLQITQILQGASPLIGHPGSQGYLGVDLTDVDNDKAQALKLKEVRGALITLIDHDAPAGKAGLRVNDVVVQLNGENVESAEQLRRMLREIPAGRKITLQISRDGGLQTLSLQLADRHAMEQDVWNHIENGGGDFPPPPGMGLLSGGASDVPGPGGFHMPGGGGGLNVGAMMEPLTSQMAEYLGISNGLIVKQVAHKSEADVAGLKAFDVVLKVGAEPISTLADWDRTLRANQGRQVQVTILRDKKQQTVTLQVDSRRHQGEIVPGIFPADAPPEIAELFPEFDLGLQPTAEPLEGAERNSPSNQNQHCAPFPGQPDAFDPGPMAHGFSDFGHQGPETGMDPRQRGESMHNQQMPPLPEMEELRHLQQELQPKEMQKHKEEFQHQMDEMRALLMDSRV
jgi:membrane-associated protease RseP (regulator of RpoE activity)